jgi:hypothetical protein
VFLVLAVTTGLSFWLFAPALIRRWFPGMLGAIGVLDLFGVIAVIAVVTQYLTGLLNSLGFFSAISRVKLLNLCLFVTGGSIAFYLYAIPGLLLFCSAVYLASGVLQALALRQAGSRIRILSGRSEFRAGRIDRSY